MFDTTIGWLPVLVMVTTVSLVSPILTLSRLMSYDAQFAAVCGSETFYPDRVGRVERVSSDHNGPVHAIAGYRTEPYRVVRRGPTAIVIEEGVMEWMDARS